MKLGPLLLSSVRATDFVKVNRLVSVPGISCPTSDTDSTTDAVKDAFSLTKVKRVFCTSKPKFSPQTPVVSGFRVSAKMGSVIFACFTCRRKRPTLGSTGKLSQISELPNQKPWLWSMTSSSWMGMTLSKEESCQASLAARQVAMVVPMQPS